MAKQQQAIMFGGLVVIAGFVLAVLHHQGKTPSVSLASQAVGQSFTPFVFWIHSDPVGYWHHFPERIGANCLPQPFQTEDIGQALNHVEHAPKLEMDYAGCAQ